MFNRRQQMYKLLPCSKGRSQSCQISWWASSSNEVQWSVESPFPVHVLPKKKIYIKTYYITVSLATLADYIIRHQWESRKLHTETPAEVIGCNSGAWCLEGSLWGSWKSFHVFNSVFSPIAGVPSVRTRDKMESCETPEISDAWAKNDQKRFDRRMI